MLSCDRFANSTSFHSYICCQLSIKCNSFVNVLYLLWLLSPFLNCHVSRCTFSHRLLGVMLTDTTRILFYSGFCTDWTLKVCVLQLYCKQLLLESLGWFDENTSFEISKFCSLFSYQASHPFFKFLTGLLLKCVVMFDAIRSTPVVLFNPTKVFLLPHRKHYRRHPCWQFISSSFRMCNVFWGFYP